MRLGAVWRERLYRLGCCCVSVSVMCGSATFPDLFCGWESRAYARENQAERESEVQRPIRTRVAGAVVFDSDLCLFRVCWDEKRSSVEQSCRRTANKKSLQE